MAALLQAQNWLAQLETREKVALLAGSDAWHTTGVERIGLPKLRLTDGPNGCRGTAFFNGTPSTCFPCGTGMAASFDVELIHRVGVQLGDEAKAKGAHVLLGPTVNIQRDPLTGRGFEMYSEDPFLSGTVATSYVKGVQSKGIAATMKHFLSAAVCNDQEFERYKSDSIVSDRALREIYLEPFRIAQAASDPKCYMAAYNRLNGTHCTENRYLLEGILRKEWGFKGLVMSDWTAVGSSAESILAGTDLEMPGPPVYRGAPTLRDLQTGKLSTDDIDARALTVLELVAWSKTQGNTFNYEETESDAQATRPLLQAAAAAAVVILKNDNKVLPIKTARKIAVIGPNARSAVVSGGGSASLLSSYQISPLEGISHAAQEIGAEVEYALGTLAYKAVPLASSFLRLPEDHSTQGMIVEFWKNQPAGFTTTAAIDIPTKPDYWTTYNSASAFMVDNMPADILKSFPYIRLTSTFMPDHDGEWIFSLSSIGESVLLIDDELVVDNTVWESGHSFFNLGSKERTAKKNGFVAGKAANFQVRSWAGSSQKSSGMGLCGGVRIGAAPIIDEEAEIVCAEELAARSDTVIVVVGLNEDFETEGHDRSFLGLPGRMDDLVCRILAVHPNAVIINQSGMPVEMPWVRSASTVVQAFYGGNALGAGLADVLFGKTQPSGRLPITFPEKYSDCLTASTFAERSPDPLRAAYLEDLFVGYRYYDLHEKITLFPFGHGLSYTEFAYSDLAVSKAESSFDVSLRISNVGAERGIAVALVFVAEEQPAVVRPRKELKGIARVDLPLKGSEVVKVNLDRNAFKYWNSRTKSWSVKAGMFELLIGESAEKIVARQTVSVDNGETWLGL